MTKTNGVWVIDMDASRILDKVYPKIVDVYDIKVEDGMDIDTVWKKMKNAQHVRDLYVGKKKILKKLNRKTLLKNNVVKHCLR